MLLVREASLVRNEKKTCLKTTQRVTSENFIASAKLFLRSEFRDRPHEAFRSEKNTFLAASAIGSSVLWADDVAVGTQTLTTCLLPQKLFLCCKDTKGFLRTTYDSPG